MTTPLNEVEHSNLLVELWKQTIAVQQHFNDLCWRIRGLALTALTFTLGAAALAAREPLEVGLFGADLQLSAMIATVGLVLWRAFYYVDRRWYHQLLKGSVIHGTALEDALQAYVPAAGLTRAISAASPYDGRSWRLRKQSVNSTMKLQRFYRVVTVLLVVFAIALQFGSTSSRRDGATDGKDSGRVDTVPPPSSPAPTSAPAATATAGVPQTPSP